MMLRVVIRANYIPETTTNEVVICESSKRLKQISFKGRSGPKKIREIPGTNWYHERSFLASHRAEMSMGLGTPINQVRLTNVAYVRLRKNNKRFEIACYRNKVLNYRTKIETDLSEVLQIDSVFTNVSKGLLASAKDLMEAFGTSDTKTVCRIILERGELQVSEEERA